MSSPPSSPPQLTPMAGLSVLLETQRNPQILRKADALRLSQTFTARRPTHQSTFLEECFLCGRHLSLEKDIYMYRGDRAFCSEECRRRQMVMDEAELRREMNCSRHRKGANKGHVAVRGGFAY